jgi:hypothetical protein
VTRGTRLPFAIDRKDQLFLTNERSIADKPVKPKIRTLRGVQGRKILRTWNLLGIIRDYDIDRKSKLEALEQAASRLLGYGALLVVSVVVIWTGFFIF